MHVARKNFLGGLDMSKMIIEKAYIMEIGDYASRRRLSILLRIPYDFEDEDLKDLIYDEWSENHNLPEALSTEAYNLLEKLKHFLKLNEMILIQKRGCSYVQIISEMNGVSNARLAELKTAIPEFQGLLLN